MEDNEPQKVLVTMQDKIHEKLRNLIDSTIIF